MKKLLSVLLCVMMVVCLMPTMAFADPDTTTSETTEYYGTVRAIPDGLSVVTSDDGFTVTTTNTSTVTLTMAYEDASIYRYGDAWWVGYIITAPEELGKTENDPIKNIEYSNDNGANWKSFWTYKDSKEGEVPYMQFWVPINTSYIENKYSTLTWTYKFKWNGDSGTVQTVKITIDMSKLDLKTVDGKDAVAITGSRCYATLSEAIDAAADEGTITLIRNVTETSGVTVGSGKNVTLDLNGKTLDLGTGGLTNEGTLLTITDTSEGKTGKVNGTITSTEAAIEITGGTYSESPAAYVADGYVAVLNDDATYTVIKADADVAPAVAAPDVKADEFSGTTQEKKAASDAAATVAVEELSDLASNEVAKITQEDAEGYLQEAATSLDTEDPINLFAQTYLQVEPKSFEGDKLVMEITPMMQIIASTADDVEDAVTESDQPSGVNAVVVKAASEIQVTAPVTVSFTLPDNYITSDERVYMEHVKKGTTYVYDVDVDGSNVATFTNPHGFSTFTLTKSGPVAKIGEVGYTSLQAAVDDVKDGETITLVGSTDETSVTVSKAVTFTLVDNGNSTDVEKYFTGDITNAYGYTVVNNNGEYTVTKNPYYYVPSTSTGDSAVDKPADEETADAIAAVEATQLKAQTKQVKVNGKAAVKVTWKAADGSDLDLDGVEIFRSVKRYSGYTAKPIFTTTKAQYYNTAVKAGTKYYYKVRGYKTIDGEKVYTGFSTKAWRTVK